MKKKHIKQTYSLILNLPHFPSWHCLGVIDLEIYRKRLLEFSILAWGQRGIIILIHRSSLASFSFVNIIYLILAKISLTGVLLLSRHVSFWNLLHCTNHS